MSSTELGALPRPSTAAPALPAILIAAVVQGWALYGLHQAIVAHHWPATHRGWLLGLYALTVLAPATLQLLVEHIRKPPLWVLVAVIGGLAFYFGWHYGTAVADQTVAPGTTPFDFFSLGFVLLVWWLLVLPFTQNRLVAGRWTVDYRLLFVHAWRNILALAEAALFTGLFWLILELWQTLFYMLGIGFFRELFEKPIFVYPVTSIVFGCALHLIGSVDRLISAVLEQILNVLKWLATVAGVLLTLFTIALVFKLPGLVASGSRAIGAGWLLWLLAVVVLFLNAAYRDGTAEQPYPRWIGQALRYSVPLTIIVSLTAFYGLGVRTAHYGLTVERVWAFVVAGAAFLYAIGYSIAALHGGRWLGGIARVNVVVALALIAMLAAALSPLLSPYRLTADSQFARALVERYGAGAPSGAATAAMRALRFNAGRYGRERLSMLAEIQGRSDADQLRALAAQMLAQKWPWETSPALDPKSIIAKLPIYPAGRTLDPGLAAVLAKDWNKPEMALFSMSARNLEAAGLFADLDGDGVDEFILLTPRGGPVYQVRTGRWEYIGDLQGPWSNWSDVLAQLARGNTATTVPQWRDLTLGSHRFRVTSRP